MFNNFSLALILFTIITRILMFPITIKQQKSTAKQQILQPRINEIQERYKNDREKMNAAMSDLYAKEGYNPTSGCLPLLIQMPLLFGLYYAIRMPLTCTFHMDNVARIASAFGINTVNNYYYEIELIDKFKNLDLNAFSSQITLSTLGEAGRAEAMRIGDICHSFNFLGLDMLKTPAFWNWNLIIPLLIFITSVGGMLITNKINGVSNSGNGQKGCNPLVLSIGMAVFSTYISFNVPSAVGFYWILSSVISPVQAWIVQKFYNANLLNSKAEAQRIARMRLNEAVLIDEIALKKGGKKIFLPVEPTEKEKKVIENEQNNNNNGSSKKKKNKNTSSGSDYQGKKK